MKQEFIILSRYRNRNQNVDSGRTETQKARPDFRAKVMYVISFDGYGQVAQVSVPKGERVTGKFYSSQVISAIEKHYLERRPRSGANGINLLQDNASGHKVKGLSRMSKGLGTKYLSILHAHQT